VPRPDFPSSFPDFMARFGTDEACSEYLRDSRWPSGFRCRRCAARKGYERADRWGVECAKCRQITSVTAGTLMDNTKLGARKWLIAAWLLVTSKRGISAKELQGQLAVGSYRTAFNLLHRLRRAMVAPDRTKLNGGVEVDEFFFGAHGDPDQVSVVGACEVRDRGPSRCRFRVIPEATAAHLEPFVREVIEPGSTVVTDGATMYKGLKGYRHEVQIVGKGYKPGEVLPYLHTAISNVRAFLAGTPHGAWQPHHLQAYLDEFAFRYNRRHNLHAAFQRILGLAAEAAPVRVRQIIGGRPGPPTRVRRKEAAHHG